MMQRNKFFKKFTQWEYWPAYMFYIPNIPYAIYLALKAKNFTFYSVVNPALKSSGNGTESKYKTLELIPEEYKPTSVYIDKQRDFNTTIRNLHKKGIDFPIIAKPDVGFRGMLVKKIMNDEELRNYLNSYQIPLILQEFIDLPNECGVFYYRIPGRAGGMIKSLTFKSFLSVIGNGFSSLSELVFFDKRAQHYVKQIKKTHAKMWDKIPAEGEKVLLSEIGNHIRGTQFLNANHLIDKELIDTFDKLNKEIKGWFYGRLDIKYNAWKELKQGKNFKILEINGIIAEPTHMYDSYRTTYFQALKTIRSHWKIACLIAIENIKKGVQPEKFQNFWSEIKWLIGYVKKITKLMKSNS